MGQDKGGPGGADDFFLRKLTLWGIFLPLLRDWRAGRQTRLYRQRKRSAEKRARESEREGREEVLEGRLRPFGDSIVWGERAYLPDRERRRSASNHLQFRFFNSSYNNFDYESVTFTYNTLSFSRHGSPRHHLPHTLRDRKHPIVSSQGPRSRPPRFPRCERPHIA